MDLYSGPRRDRPETIHSDYAKGLFLIVLVCAFTAIVFLFAGMSDMVKPVRRIEAERLYAMLGIGSVAALIALMGINALRKEWSQVSPVYVEFKDKQLRNILIEGEVYFLAKDIADSIFLKQEERSRELTGFGQRKGCRRVHGKVFVSISAIEKYLSTRDDRTSILLKRELNRLSFSRLRAEEA